jgi:hypothetical protein
MRKSYTSDLTDQQWALMEPLIPPARTGGDRRTSDMLEVACGIFYVLKNGCQWRDLPGAESRDLLWMGGVDRWSSVGSHLSHCFHARSPVRLPLYL